MRTIIHSDINSFYASVEQAENPSLRGTPVVVGGDEEARHGIVLAASYEAKRFGVKTAMTLCEARRICPELTVVPVRFDLYHRYSKMARKIYYEYTDLVEPFGPDEAWLDITGTKHLFGDNEVLIAQEISERIKTELGVSVSIGLSWNKIFAKFGSDYEKPDGFTVITPDNMKDIVWTSKVQDLLYVGSATRKKLNKIGITKIGQLATCDVQILQKLLGKMGLVLQQFALGNDDSEVRPLDLDTIDTAREPKSIGNGITLPLDVTDRVAAKQVVWLLGESVAQRLREYDLDCLSVSIALKHTATLQTQSWQMTFERPTNITDEICKGAYSLFEKNWNIDKYPIRAITVSISKFVSSEKLVQLDLLGNGQKRLQKRRVDTAVDKLRNRFGNHSVRRGVELYQPDFSGLDPKRDHTTHPVSYFS